MPITKLFVCELLINETRSAVALEELRDVDIIAYKSGIRSQADSIESLSNLIEGISESDAVCIVGSEWITSLTSIKTRVKSTAHFVQPGNCYELIAGKTLSDQLLEKGAYLVYPGILDRSEEILASFDPRHPINKDCLIGSMKKIIFLETGVGPGTDMTLEDLAVIFDLPCEHLFIGLDIFRLNISKGIMAARLNQENELSKHVGQTEAKIRADYAMAFDMIQQISQESDEGKVIDSILNIMDLFFAPESRCYYSVDENGNILRSFGEDRFTEGYPLGLDSISSGYDQSIKGLRLKIENKGKILGIVVIRSIAFPEFWRQYISLGLQMAPVFGLAIANARSFRDLLESERRVEHALRIEIATLDISKHFLGQVAIETAVPEALQLIGEATGSDRVSFFQVSQGYSEIVKVYEWVDKLPYAIPPIENVTKINDQAWLMGQLGNHDEILIEDMERLTTQAGQQLALFGGGTASSMAIRAIKVDGHVNGFICVQYLQGPRKWEEDHVRMLRFLCQTISMTLQERKTQLDVTRENESLIVTHKVLRHDIKNELMVVNGSLELLSLNKERKNIDRAIASTAKIHEMIEQFKQLDAFLLSGKGLFACDIVDMIHKVMLNHHLHYLVKGDGTIMADYALSSMLDNLVNNSRRHGLAESIVFEIRSNGLFVEMTVADDGVGIPAEIKKMIFHEGFSFGHNKSTGLGLFLIRKTMDRYGGQITVEDNDPKGTKFVLRFPGNGA